MIVAAPFHFPKPNLQQGRELLANIRHPTKVTVGPCKEVHTECQQYIPASCLKLYIYKQKE